MYIKQVGRSLLTSPGLLDIQLNGAYGFDFSIYEDTDETYQQGMQMIAERIVETGVTSYVCYSVIYQLVADILLPDSCLPLL